MRICSESLDTIDAVVTMVAIDTIVAMDTMDHLGSAQCESIVHLDFTKYEPFVILKNPIL